jgi:hypothetical protein
MTKKMAPKRDAAQTSDEAGATPFSAINAPKSSWGSLPPVTQEA